MDNHIAFPEPLSSFVSLEPKTITNIYGAPGTGKTCLCLLALMKCIENGGKIVYIDTEGGFSPERLRQISNNNAERILERMEIIQPRTFEEQGKVIKSLEKKNADLIVLDSAVALYRLEYADPKNETIEANRELSVQLSILSNIARDRNIPVMITAHTFQNWETGENEVVGGNIRQDFREKGHNIQAQASA